MQMIHIASVHAKKTKLTFHKSNFTH